MVDAVVSFANVNRTQIGGPAPIVIELNYATCRVNGVAAADTGFKPELIIRNLKIITKTFD
jgi:hypothetical protein